MKGRVRVAEETMELLLYSWPGNVRQLQNELRRMVALAEADAVLTPAALSHEIRRATATGSGRSTGGPELAVSLSPRNSRPPFRKIGARDDSRRAPRE